MLFRPWRLRCDLEQHLEGMPMIGMSSARDRAAGREVAGRDEHRRALQHQRWGECHGGGETEVRLFCCVEGAGTGDGAG